VNFKATAQKTKTKEDALDVNTMLVFASGRLLWRLLLR